MGKKPDQIQREIAEHRQRMSAKIERLEERIQSDARGVRDRVGERTPGTDALSNLSRRISEHPRSSIAGGFGVGVALGMLGPGVSQLIPSRGNGRHEARGERESSRDGVSGGGLMGMLSGSVMTAVDDAVRPLIRDAVAGFRGDDRPPERREEAESRRNPEEEREQVAGRS